ncbi:MAG: hypothetical protein AAF443_03610 [Chlamydiota bacterium]
MIWRGYFDRLFSWVLIRQVDKTQGKIGQKRPSNSAKFLHFESAWVYTRDESICKKWAGAKGSRAFFTQIGFKIKFNWILKSVYEITFV